MKKIQISGLILLLIVSTIYNYQKPEEVVESVHYVSVTLEGEFLINGEYQCDKVMSVEDLINEVGVSNEANLNALNLDYVVMDESRLYLPKKTEQSVSLNNASKEELMTLKGIGEKTALKIIEYRESVPFYTIEDIMNISGIGEKTYLKLRDYLCL